MSTVSLRHPGELQRYAGSWAVSVLLHGLAVGVATLLVSNLHLAPQSEPFRWEIAVVHEPARTPAPAAAPPAPAQTKPPVQPVQPVEQVREVQTVVRQEVREIKPIVREIETVPVMTQTAPSPQAIREITQPPAQAQAESVATRETRQVVQETPVAAASVESATTSTTAQIVAKATSVEPVAPPRPLPDAAPPASVVQEPKLQEVPVQSAPAVEQSSVKEVQVRAVPAPKADYGWLAQTLWSRVERFKRYPAAARANRMEGRVLLRAVIGDDGGLRSLDVLEGSGHEELDQAALEAVRRATPLQLPHELGRPQVVVQIPITYKLR